MEKASWRPIQVYSMAKSSGCTGETLNLSMTAKQPPSYDGKVSWFRYEELVDEVTITTVETPKRTTPDSQEMLTCTRQSSKMTFCKILSQKAEPRVPHFHLQIRNPSREIEGSMMPVFTAQSPSFRQSVQDANARTIARHQQAAGTRAPPPVLLNEDDPTVLRQYITGMQDDAFPFGDNLIRVNCQISREKD